MAMHIIKVGVSLDSPFPEPQVYQSISNTQEIKFCSFLDIATTLRKNIWILLAVKLRHAEFAQTNHSTKLVAQRLTLP